jgi:hypothetical protein
MDRSRTPQAVMNCQPAGRGMQRSHWVIETGTGHEARVLERVMVGSAMVAAKTNISYTVCKYSKTCLKRTLY